MHKLLVFIKNQILVLISKFIL